MGKNRFYKILAFAALMLELILLLVLCLHFKPIVAIITGLLIIPPALIVLFKQYFVEIYLPKSIVLVFCGILLDLGVFGLLRGYSDIQWSTSGGFIILLITTFLFIRKNKGKIEPYLVMFYLLIGISIIQVPIRIYDFTGTLPTLPDYLMHVLGVIAGFFFYYRVKLVRMINLSVSVLLVLFVYFYGYDMWMNKLDYGTVSGKVHIKAPNDIKLVDINNVPVNIKNGKLTVMDFWFSTCGACFAAFPQFQKYYNEYKSNPRVQFYTINQPLRGEKIINNFKLLTKRGYTFPMAAAGYDKVVAKALDIRAYPTTVVMDERGIVIYKGDLTGAMATVKNYLPTEK